MTDFGEAITFAISTDRHDEDCYFCNSHPTPKDDSLVVTDDYDEDKDLDGADATVERFYNSAKQLGTALGGKPSRRDLKLSEEGEYPCSVAAHHLIPGNASLKRSELFTSAKYLRVEGSAKGNIGYDVNSAPNGQWLPGNYAQRPWGTDGADFQKKSGLSPQTYAFAAIETYMCQFHDAHEDYSRFVIKVLNQIATKLDLVGRIWCPNADQEEEKPENRNLYALVNRLHTVSARIRRMLVFPTANWKRNVHTSRFAQQYMATHKPS